MAQSKGRQPLVLLAKLQKEDSQKKLCDTKSYQVNLFVVVLLALLLTLPVMLSHCEDHLLKQTSILNIQAPKVQKQFLPMR